jgi:hypothetical protein
MSQINNQDTGLTYQILTSKRPGLSRGLPPGKEDLAWVANSATLISGQRDAVLVDTFLTSEQAKTLADWVAANDPRIIDETRRYLRDFNRLNAKTSTARELYDAMLEIYPERANPGSLWGGANKAKELAQAAK